jgi:phosphatidyl-myo-inositol dimannoside synthase
LNGPDARGRILVLVPSIGTLGGIQTSGRIAWEAISACAEPSASRPFESAQLFCYCGGPQRCRRYHIGNAQHARTKLQAVLGALRTRSEMDLVLVWHIGLLKLLPFLQVPRARVALFLFGVEAWRRQDPLTRALLRRVDRVFSISEYTWQRFVADNHEFIRLPRQTVPLGIDRAVRGSSPPTQTPPVALMLSRLAPSEAYKGHERVIEAWPLVLAGAPDAELWIAGDGELRSFLQRQAAQHGVAARVRFWGLVSEQQKQELLARATCLLMPSRKEGFGLVYLEAMRLGRPCLVSTLDAAREVVNPPEAGLAADPDDIEGLAAAIRQLLTAGRPEWNDWSQAARCRYESTYTAEHFQQRLLAALVPLCQAGA